MQTLRRTLRKMLIFMFVLWYAQNYAFFCNVMKLLVSFFCLIWSVLWICLPCYDTLSIMLFSVMLYHVPYYPFSVMLWYIQYCAICFMWRYAQYRSFIFSFNMLSIDGFVIGSMLDCFLLYEKMVIIVLLSVLLYMVC